MAEKKQKHMTCRQRNALLALHGITLASIAKATGRDITTVCVVMNKFPKKKSIVIQEYIAAHTGKTFEQIWGIPTSRQTRKQPEKGKHTCTIPEKKGTVND